MHQRRCVVWEEQTRKVIARWSQAAAQHRPELKLVARCKLVRHLGELGLEFGRLCVESRAHERRIAEWDPSDLDAEADYGAIGAFGDAQRHWEVGR
jgi:hypothetical protein